MGGFWNFQSCVLDDVATQNNKVVTCAPGICVRLVFINLLAHDSCSLCELGFRNFEAIFKLKFEIFDGAFIAIIDDVGVPV